jgi:hypothetical protein
MFDVPPGSIECGLKRSNRVVLRKAILGAPLGHCFIHGTAASNQLAALFKFQLDLCFLATETVARLATETDPAEWKKAHLVFWRLYWRQLSIAENRRIEAAMVELGKLVPADPVEAPVLPMKSLGPLSYRLAHAVRDPCGRKLDSQTVPSSREQAGRSIAMTAFRHDAFALP